MAYVSLYRRFRSQRFDEIVGQEHVKKALTNALSSDTVGHAYLFSGPRGTGKTSTARILAKALNCESLAGGEPCGACDSCKSIEIGTSLDVYELDAASNNSVDDIRQLVASTALGTAGRTKVYVLDEVHMLSKAASNALLKTLEEPPEHVVFVLATTDPQKVLPTIRSRTQHYEFTLLAAQDLAAHVRVVIEAASLDVDDDMVDEIVRRGAGSARDTLSVLDQVAAAGGVAKTGADVDEIVNALIANDVAAVLGAVASAISAGADPREMGESLTRLLRDMFLTVMGVETAEVPDSVRAKMQDQARALGAARTVKAMETVGLALTEMRQATDARLTLEVALIQLAGLSALEVAPAAPQAQAQAQAQAPATAPAKQTAQPAFTAAPSVAAAPVATATPEPTKPETPAEVHNQPQRVSPAVAAREALMKSSAPPTPMSARRGAGTAPAKLVVPDGLDSSDATEPVEPATSKQADAPVVDASADPTPGPPVTLVEAEAETETEPQTQTQPAGAQPSAATLNAEWHDQLMTKASGKIRALYSAGTFEEVSDGTAVFSLPTGPHMARCDPIRGEVEALIEKHYGVHLELVLMIEGAKVPARDSDEPVQRPQADDSVDLGDLTDADDAPTTSLEMLQNAFPGSELESTDEAQ